MNVKAHVCSYMYLLMCATACKNAHGECIAPTDTLNQTTTYKRCNGSLCDLSVRPCTLRLPCLLKQRRVLLASQEVSGLPNWRLGFAWTPELSKGHAGLEFLGVLGVLGAYRAFIGFLALLGLLGASRAFRVSRRF